MRTVKACGLILLLFAASAVVAQQTATLPQLDTPPSPTDSPLVRLAKETRAKKKPAVYIDNKTVATSTGVLTTSAYLPPPPRARTETARVDSLHVAQIAHQREQARQKIESAQQKIQALEVERQRMAREELEQTPQDVDHDVIQQRLNAIPGEIQKAREDLQKATSELQSVPEPPQ